jgi:hypothetical protein
MRDGDKGMKGKRKARKPEKGEDIKKKIIPLSVQQHFPFSTY